MLYSIAYGWALQHFEDFCIFYEVFQTYETIEVEILES